MLFPGNDNLLITKVLAQPYQRLKCRQLAKMLAERASNPFLTSIPGSLGGQILESECGLFESLR